MKILHLSLKEKWFKMIASGEKKEEYRELNEYWYKRLTGNGTTKHFDVVHFTLGYPKKTDLSRQMWFKIEDITIGTGNPSWGAKPDKEYFVIKLKERKK